MFTKRVKGRFIRMDHTTRSLRTPRPIFFTNKKKSLRLFFLNKTLIIGVFRSKIEVGFQNKFSRPCIYPKYVFRVIQVKIHSIVQTSTIELTKDIQADRHRNFVKITFLSIGYPKTDAPTIISTSIFIYFSTVQYIIIICEKGLF